MPIQFLRRSSYNLPTYIEIMMKSITLAQNDPRVYRTKTGYELDPRSAATSINKMVDLKDSNTVTSLYR